MTKPSDQNCRSLPMPEPDVGLALAASARVAAMLKGAHSSPEGIEVRVVGKGLEDGTPDAVILPVTAVRLLLDILREMARGNAVSIMPIHAELTTQQAADFLNVSRPFLVGLLKQGKIHHLKVGTHRRIKFSDLKDYKIKQEQEQNQIMEKLAAEAQRLNLGY